MKNIKKTLYLLILGILFICPVIARADGGQTRMLQVSLVSPVQIYPANDSVNGLRLNILYGVNEDLQGIDIGFINDLKGSAQALEIGIVNQVDQNFGGVQFGLVNDVGGDLKGLQLAAFVNVTKSSSGGFQMGVFYNDAEQDFHGLQFGLVNHAGVLDGIQIGLLNFDDAPGRLGFLPFIHATF